MLARRPKALGDFEKVPFPRCLLVEATPSSARAGRAAQERPALVCTRLLATRGQEDLEGHASMTGGCSNAPAGFLSPTPQNSAKDVGES